MPKKTTVRRVAGGLVALALTAGCASSGPRTIPKDRVNYQEALSSSAKTQLLLNLVRVRYVDPPIFLEVASIVNSYSWDAGVSAGVEFGPGAEKYGVDANGAYGDHPTISYSPLSGEKFSRSMMTPLTPLAVLSLVQVGYPVDAVFRLCVKSVNGVFNQSGASSLKRPADPSFVPLLEALRRIQLSGTVALRVEKHDDEETALIVMRAGHSAELEADRETVARILGLEKSDEYKLVFGMLSSHAGEIALLTRSMLEIMGELAAGIDVPEQEIAELRVSPPPSFDGAETLPALLRVHCAAEAPADAFAAARYRNHWYWIDDREIPSKRIFAFVTLLFSLAETGGSPNLPVLTIPTG
jgi:hypothetical protein